MLAQNLKQLGITLNVKQVPIEQWFNTLYTHPKPMGMQIVSWGVDYPDPADALRFIYPSANATKNKFNTANYKSAQMDELLDAAEPVGRPARHAPPRSAKALRLARDATCRTSRSGTRRSRWRSNSQVRVPGFGTWYLYTPWAADISAT